MPYNNKVNGISIEAENLRNIGAYLQKCAVEIREGDFEKRARTCRPEILFISIHPMFQ